MRRFTTHVSMALAGAVIALGATACGSGQDVTPQEQRRAIGVLGDTPVVSGTSLAGCLRDHDWKLHDSYASQNGNIRNIQLVYTNGKASAMTISVELDSRTALPWDDKAASTLRLNGCTVAGPPLGAGDN